MEAKANEHLTPENSRFGTAFHQSSQIIKEELNHLRIPLQNDTEHTSLIITEEALLANYMMPAKLKKSYRANSLASTRLDGEFLDGEISSIDYIEAKTKLHQQGIKILSEARRQQQKEDHKEMRLDQRNIEPQHILTPTEQAQDKDLSQFRKQELEQEKEEARENDRNDDMFGRFLKR